MIGTMDAQHAGALADAPVAAEPHAPVAFGSPCADCAQPLAEQFFLLNGAPICPRCSGRLEGSPRHAVLFGLSATLASIAAYYAIFLLTGFRFVFIAVLAGVFIGAAVRKGAHASKRLRYRWFSVVLTYLAVVATYAHTVAEMPFVTSGADAILRSLYLPLLMIAGQKNVVTLILLGFGLHEAWKFSGPPYAHIEGPLPTTAA